MRERVCLKDKVTQLVNLHIGGLVLESNGHFILAIIDNLYLKTREVYLIELFDLLAQAAFESDLPVANSIEGISELQKDGWLVLTTNKQGIDVLFPGDRLMFRYNGKKKKIG